MPAVLTLCFLCLVTALVQGDNAFFSPPTSGFNVTEGAQVTVAWITEWGTVPVSLIVFQQDVYQVLLSKCWVGPD